MKQVENADREISNRGSFRWWNRFDITYHRIKRRFPDVYTLADEELKAVQFVLEKTEGAFAAALYVLAMVSVLPIFGILLYTRELWVAHSAQINLLLRRWLFEPRHSDLRRLLSITICVWAFYCFLPFILKHVDVRRFFFMGSRIKNHFLFNVDPLTSRVLAIFGAYFLYLPISVYVTSRFTKFDWLAPILGIWLLIPYVALCLLSIFLTSIFLARKWIDRIARRASFYRTLTKLMRLILRLSSVPGASLTIPRREVIASEINAIADGLEEIFAPHEFAQKVWVTSHLSALGAKFRQLTYWLYFPQADTIPAIQKSS